MSEHVSQKEDYMKKPIYKKWWFWVIIVVVVIAVVGSSSSDSDDSAPTDGVSEIADNNSSTSTTPASVEKQYQEVDLQSMLDELKENALRAENKYQNSYVEFTCKIASFDSDGAYITVEPIGAGMYNFDTVMCYIKNAEQKSFVIEKNVGDQVTIKGKIISIGEVLGYSLNIDSIS